MRLFLSINLNPQVREEVAKELPTIQRYFKGKFVPKENWHVTMLFLGEVDDHLIPQLEEAMDTAAKKANPFSLYIEGIGAFPSAKKPNILWAGVKGDLDPLQRLYDDLLQELKKTPIPFDAKPKYTPHLTLARKAEILSKENPFDEVHLKSTEWQVNALECYQSILKPGGAEYKNILQKRFGENE